MIADQKIGRSFMDALDYNLRKVNHRDINKRAQLLETNFDCTTLKQVKREIDLIRELRPNLNRYVYHTSLNFPVDDEPLLNDEKLLAIGHEYLDANGFNNNQYLIFRHYDAGHPHLHLLANRIRFDGSVVSDSNNYKRSEEILRTLEKRYNLTSVASSRNASQRAAKKDEIEMAVRTGKPSEKMLLQEKLKQLIGQKDIKMQNLILQGEAQGIHFLFNQASTGLISGITYFHNDFKITGKVLGNQFKWSELIKRVNYEQIRDSKAVSEANSRTTEKYGDLSTTGAYTPVSKKRRSRINVVSENVGPNLSEFGGLEIKNGIDAKRPMDADQDVNLLVNGTPDFDSYQLDDFSIEIADDEDDSKYRRRNRWMGR